MDSKNGEGLSDYVGKKVNDLLGHHNKDFIQDANGHLCKVALGSKCGVYGSFLSTHIQVNNEPVPNENKTQTAMVQKPFDALKELITFTWHPFCFSKSPNGPSSAMQNVSNKVVKPSVNPVKPVDSSFNLAKHCNKPVNPVKPSDKLVNASVNPVISSDSLVNYPAKLSDKLVNPSVNLVVSSDKPVKPVKPFDETVNLVKPIYKPVNASFNPDNLSDKSVIPSDNSVKEPEAKAKEKRRPKIIIKLGSLAKKAELIENSKIQRGGNENAALYRDLGLELSPFSDERFEETDDDDVSPFKMLENMPSIFPPRGKQTLISPLKSKTTNLKKETNTNKSLHAGSNGRKAMVQKEATQMVAQENVTADPTATSVDNWVECDRCRKWRMLPNWIKPTDLPDKWMCCMINWLDVGMNSCRLSEEETTEALYAVYRVRSLELRTSKMYGSQMPGGTVRMNGAKNVMKPSGGQPTTGTEGVKPAGTALRIGGKHIVMPAGTVKAELKKANAEQFKDNNRTARGDLKLSKKRVIDQSADDLRPFKKPIKKESEPVKKSGNRVSEPINKSGNAIHEPAMKPRNKALDLAKKWGNKVPEPTNKWGKKVPERKNKVQEPKKWGKKMMELARKSNPTFKRRGR